MSVQSNIDIVYNEKINFIELLTSLEKSGMNYSDYGNITYLNNNDFDWRSGHLEDIKEIKDYLNRLFKGGNKIALVIVDDNKVGISLHINSDRELSLSLSINRRKIGDNSTDFSYYLQKVDIILKDVQSITCTDIY
ncbi:hypothetical protein AB9P05_04005 [Roseivirga sp. BDSF3-8]|uniref:hypothetical protein n=1 Tax=Roseivirga sp. BDSF3-8 TaxID=3241598 RepID=UPI0035325787